MGLPEDVTAALAGLKWGWSIEGVSEAEAQELNLNPDDRRLKLTLQLAASADRHAAPPLAAPWRVRADAGPSGRTGPDRAGRACETGR